METKKLKKLKINKMDSFSVISAQEQMALKGGFPWLKILQYIFKPLPAGEGSDITPDEYPDFYGTTISLEEAHEIMDSYGYSAEDFYNYAVSDNA